MTANSIAITHAKAWNRDRADLAMQPGCIATTLAQIFSVQRIWGLMHCSMTLHTKRLRIYRATVRLIGIPPTRATRPPFARAEAYTPDWSRAKPALRIPPLAMQARHAPQFRR